MGSTAGLRVLLPRRRAGIRARRRRAVVGARLPRHLLAGPPAGAGAAAGRAGALVVRLLVLCCRAAVPAGSRVAGERRDRRAPAAARAPSVLLLAGVHA